MRPAYRELRTDRTVTCPATRRDGHWHTGAPTSHHSSPPRTYYPRTNCWDVRHHTLTADLQLPPDDALADLQQALHHLDTVPWPPQTTPTLQLTRSLRDYRNSEGMTTALATDTWDLSLHGPTGTSLRRLTHSPAALARLAARLAAQWQQQHHQPPPAPAPLPDHTALVLAPAVAGVLIHELIGHALEEGDLPPRTPVLPAHTRITAPPAAGRPADDEGVTTRALTLVDDGTTALAPTDRTTTPHDSCPAGHAWCAPHGLQPRLRLLDLTVHNPAAPHGHGAWPAATAYCTAVRGAQYHAGQALLDISHAELVTSGTAPLLLAPFRLAAGHRDLARAVFTTTTPALLDKPDHAPRGACIKHGDLLPSRVQCPPLLLPHPRVMRYGR
ncbi:hypothetical protein ACFU99_01640 [Streptomyces sp. NPDC057654]|uniref:hypothetical protein n=1 Tax=Streptomyces sp. NPDC057654 TaxID=3346196 RepID=UPI0036CC1D2D